MIYFKKSDLTLLFWKKKFPNVTDCFVKDRQKYFQNGLQKNLKYFSKRTTTFFCFIVWNILFFPKSTDCVALILQHLWQILYFSFTKLCFCYRFFLQTFFSPSEICNLPVWAINMCLRYRKWHAKHHSSKWPSN